MKLSVGLVTLASLAVAWGAQLRTRGRDEDVPDPPNRTTTFSKTWVETCENISLAECTGSYVGWGVHYLQECAISSSKALCLSTGERCTRSSELFVEYLVVAGGGGGASGGGEVKVSSPANNWRTEGGSKQGIEGGGGGRVTLSLVRSWPKEEAKELEVGGSGGSGAKRALAKRHTALEQKCLFFYCGTVPPGLRAIGKAVP